MILLDCGNSQIKGQHRRGGKAIDSYFHAYDEGWEAALANWLTERGSQQCYLASVLDAERQQRLDAVLARCSDDGVTRLVSEAEALGVVNGYDNPGQLGVDRWLALLGAAELVDVDCLVIDAGSAITLDLLRADGSHLGGAILPGCSTSLEQFQRIFSHIDFDDPAIAEVDKPGLSTAAAIQIGYTQDALENLSALVERWRPLLSDNAAFLLTGGDAYKVQRVLKHDSRIVPDLVFRGMQRMANA